MAEPDHVVWIWIDTAAIGIRRAGRPAPGPIVVVQDGVARRAMRVDLKDVQGSVVYSRRRSPQFGVSVWIEIESGEVAIHAS